ncbi:MAG: hypothetical protein NTX11_03110 [Candidatus Saccharibacteria bacterium]|nr:hypothetical protein [Candidatus Saccharibacteria bacterium]
MISGEFGTFSAQPIDRKINFHSVSEGFFVVADHSPERPFLATLGLFTCKAIAVHSPESQRGLLAHLSHAQLLDLDIERLVRQFGDGFEAASVQIVQTQQHGNEVEWPSSDRIATEVCKYAPASISIDRNVDAHEIRGVALDLTNGALYELDNESADMWHGSVEFSKNTPISPQFSSFRSR